MIEKNNDIEEQIPKKYIQKEIYYKKGETYAITINLDNTIQEKIKAKDGYDKMVKLKNYILEKITMIPMKDIGVLLHLDISEPRVVNKNFPRIHFHGLIQLKTDKGVREFLLTLLFELHIHCYVEIDTYDKDPAYEMYCKKYDHITNIEPISYGLAWSKKIIN